MAIDYEAVLRHPRIEHALNAEGLGEAESAEDFLADLISEQAKTVLTLSWDCDRPGGGGVNWIQEWNGVYFFGSSDYDDEGPFETLDEALELECFHVGGTPHPELCCDALADRQLMKVARNLTRLDGETIHINGREYVNLRGALVRTDQREGGAQVR